MTRPKALLDALEDKFLVDDGCWTWTASKLRGGYGNIRRNGENILAHRVLYELLVGPIPDGMQLDHLCRNRSCVRPDHLEPVSSQENTLRSPISPTAINARKTHCLRGHEFTEENTYANTWPNSRSCRKCALRRAYEQKRRKKL